MSTITKTQIIENISKETSLSKKDVKTAIEGFFSAVENELQLGNKVQLQAIGTFEVRDCAARTARDPRNPEVTIPVPACKRPVFKFSDKVKNKMNG